MTNPFKKKFDFHFCFSAKKEWREKYKDWLFLDF